MIIEKVGADEEQIAQWLTEDAVARRYVAFFRSFGLEPGTGAKSAAGVAGQSATAAGRLHQGVAGQAV